jgi:hypothetical protein
MATDAARQPPAVGDVTGILRGLRRRVRALSDDADELASRLEKLATFIDAVIASGTSPAGSQSGELGVPLPPARRRADSVPPVVRLIRCEARSDGAVFARADGAAPLVLPDGVGSLLLALAGRGGREIGDGLAGFKSVDDLRRRLETRLARVVARRALVPLVYRLRQSMAFAVADGARLVEHRRGYGYRLRGCVPPGGRDTP